MKTESESYADYLEEKYLPGRDLYLNRLFYPRIYREVGEGPVVDLGFGAGAFLRFLKSKNRACLGIDSNPKFVELAKDFDVGLDDITKLATLTAPIENAVTDNVLEHLTPEQIKSFFKALSEKLSRTGRLIAIVPDAKGYEKDPTHQTFVTREFLEPICSAYNLTIEKYFCYPFNSRAVGKVFYLNMQILVISHAQKKSR